MVEDQGRRHALAVRQPLASPAPPAPSAPHHPHSPWWGRRAEELEGKAPKQATEHRHQHSPTRVAGQAYAAAAGPHKPEKALNPDFHTELETKHGA